MIRATLGLVTVLLAGVVAVWWTARNLDPMRVLEQIVPAQVRTVDLTGSGPFLRQHPETDAGAPPDASPKRQGPPGSDPEPASEPARGPLTPEPSTSPRSEGRASQEGSPQDAPDAPETTEVVGRAPAADAQTSQSAGPPLDPAVSAALIRRMLALYERTGVPE